MLSCHLVTLSSCQGLAHAIIDLDAIVKRATKQMRYIIGVDLGGTQLRAALADEQGRLLDEVRVRTLVDEGPAAVIDRIVACVERVRAALPAGGMLAGVGVGAPGPLDPYEGVVLDPPT